MAEPLNSPSGMLCVVEHTLGDKAATATWLHDSRAVWPWEIQAALMHSEAGVHLTVQSQFLQLLKTVVY